MPLAPVDDKGTQLYYEDSGVPSDASNDYTTVVILHGTFFNCGVFRPLLPYAAKNNLRLVLLNQRDYSGSTPLRQNELDGLCSPDKNVQGATMQARGAEIAEFLVWFAETHNIPTLREESGKRVGGLALVSWSSGSLTTLALLAHLDKLVQRTRDVLALYWRSLLVYDPPFYVVGLTPPSGDEIYVPVRDTSLTPERGAPQFPEWVSGHFLQPFDFLPPANGPLPSRAELASMIARKPMIDPAPTMRRMSLEELAEITDTGSIQRSQMRMLTLDRSIYAENLRRAVFDDELAKCLLPQVKVTAVFCEFSIGDSVICAWELTRLVHLYGPHCGRKMSLVRFSEPGANHFSHFEIPQKTLKLFTEHV